MISVWQEQHHLELQNVFTTFLAVVIAIFLELKLVMMDFSNLENPLSSGVSGEN